MQEDLKNKKEQVGIFWDKVSEFVGCWSSLFGTFECNLIFIVGVCQLTVEGSREILSLTNLSLGVMFFFDSILKPVLS